MTRWLNLRHIICLVILVVAILQLKAILIIMPSNLAKVNTQDDDMNPLTLEQQLLYLQLNTSTDHTEIDVEPVDDMELEDKRGQKETENILVGAKVTTARYWFFQNGTVWPTGQNAPNDGRKLKIWPHEDPDHDRIVDQLMYIPINYDPTDVKRVVLANDKPWNDWTYPVSQVDLVFQECPVKACTLSSNSSEAESADAIIFKDENAPKYRRTNSKQIWILYLLESPANYPIDYSDIDWTATYRTDSDIANPYGKWVYYDENVTTLEKNRLVNFASGKTHQVAWFVSNCNVVSDRMKYARNLQKYISVDIYGACGDHSCPRSNADACFQLLNTKYKFYLSFENSHCNDYITEKFFTNGLGQNVLPIVMGAEKSQYLRSAPFHSFIHVDDFESPKQLAEYLHQLDKNDTLYNEYFQWKGTGEIINAHFWCRLCTMLHDVGSKISRNRYNMHQWWHSGTCWKKSYLYT